MVRGQSSKKVTGIADLEQWVLELQTDCNRHYPDISIEEDLARIHRATITKLVQLDAQVKNALTVAYTRAIKSQHPQAVLATMKNLLGTAAWISARASTTSRQTQGVGTRTETRKELIAAAKAAGKLAKTLANLGAARHANQLQYLEGRRDASQLHGFSELLKGWAAAGVKYDGRALDVILNVLHDDLSERAHLIAMGIGSHRQTRGSKAELYFLIDALSQRSVALSNLDQHGKLRPDYPLVFSLVTALYPEQELDVSTIRKRWTAQLLKARKTRI